MITVFPKYLNTVIWFMLTVILWYDIYVSFMTSSLIYTQHLQTCMHAHMHTTCIYICACVFIYCTPILCYYLQKCVHLLSTEIPTVQMLSLMMSNVSIICSDTTSWHEICHTSRPDKNPMDHMFLQMFVYTTHRMI